MSPCPGSWTNGGNHFWNMPVFVVENRLVGNKAYCILNEGIGKVLRFGAYSQEVIDRLIDQRRLRTNHCCITINRRRHQLECIDCPVDHNGDEFHQRNIAASLNFEKEIAPLIIQTEIDEKQNMK